MASYLFSDILTQIKHLQRLFTADEIQIPDGNSKSNWQISITPKGSFFKLNFAVPSNDAMRPINVTLDASKFLRIHTDVTEDKIFQVQEYLSEMTNVTSGVPDICNLVDATMDFLLILSDAKKTKSSASTDQLEQTNATEIDDPSPQSCKVNDASVSKVSPIDGVVCKFYLEGKCRFGDQCINLHIGDSVKQKGSKKEKTFDKKDQLQQKQPMKTAIDVINRILWDDSLPTDRFRIGYLDRFLGVLEKPFICFSWEDIASVDYTTLAIPKHRIQYFKYRTAKVWDKKERVDHVFGSTGSDKNIYDLMNRVDIEYESGPPESSRGFSALMPATLGQGIDHTGTEGHREGSDDDTDDDGIVITIRDHPRPDAASSYPDADRPNYFLAAHVTDPEILDNVRVVTDHMMAQDPRLADSLIPRHRLHLTTCMFRLDSHDEVAEAVAAVRDLPRHVPPPSASIAIGKNTVETPTTAAEPSTTVATTITASTTTITGETSTTAGTTTAVYTPTTAAETSTTDVIITTADTTTIAAETSTTAGTTTTAVNTTTITAHTTTANTNTATTAHTNTTTALTAADTTTTAQTTTTADHTTTTAGATTIPAVHGLGGTTCTTRNSAAPHQPLQISFRGLGTFFGRVVYMRPATEGPSKGGGSDAEAAALVSYVQRLSDYFARRGVRLAPGFAYVPHVTLAKKTRQMTRETFSMYIDPSVYAEHADRTFGSQPLTELFLHPCGDQLAPEDPYRVVAHTSLVEP